jgi:hypothetical protein
MSDRKYRQRGYMDDPRDRERGPKAKPTGESTREQTPRGQPPLAPKSPNMPGFREVVRCARCGHVLSPPIGYETRCERCGTELHSCAQCAHFDTGSRFECTQPILARVSPKDAKNACTLFEARLTVERETKSSGGPPSARKAFDDLFKF